MSFLSVLEGDFSNRKDATLIHYDPRWGRASANRNRFSMTDQYKLYQNGNFYQFTSDIDEERPIADLSASEEEVRETLHQMLLIAGEESEWNETPGDQE
jgi:hypothetical protein